jgi:isoleucyl-tRNA synthetase
VPYLADEIHLALRGLTPADGGGASVHLESFPRADAAAMDETLEATMETALAVASLGRTVRNDAGVRVRQPLSEILVHANDPAALDRLIDDAGISGLVLDELNVRAVRRLDDLSEVVRLSATPAFPVLGKKYGKRVPQIAQAIKSAPQDALAAFMKSGALTLEVEGGAVEITREDATVQVSATDGFGAAEERGLTVIMNLTIDDDLRLEGVARELINRLQNLRKNSGYDVTDRIRLRYQGGDITAQAFAAAGDTIAVETLADDVAAGAVDWEHHTEVELDGEHITLWVQKCR